VRHLWIVLAFAAGWMLGSATTERSVRRRIRQIAKSVELAERELDELLRERQN
jgi:hypothetical protein